MKKYLWFLVAVCIILLGRQGWFFVHKSPGFSVSKMKAPIPYTPEWDVALPWGEQEERLNEIFTQKFYFYSSGYQSYAFISEDEKTIIKFFRMKRLSYSFFDPLLHPRKVELHKKNLSLIFDAYKLAYEEMREDTGLLYIHLNKTNFFKKTLSITDQKGNEHFVDLDKVSYIVQERAEPLFVHLHKYIERKDKEGFDGAVNALLALIKRRHDKGIGDEDRGISENYGFIGERPIQFDIGRIYKGNFEGEYEEILKRLNWWVHLNPIP